MRVDIDRYRQTYSHMHARTSRTPRKPVSAFNFLLSRQRERCETKIFCESNKTWFLSGVLSPVTSTVLGEDGAVDVTNLTDKLSLQSNNAAY